LPSLAWPSPPGIDLLLRSWWVADFVVGAALVRAAWLELQYVKATNPLRISDAVLIAKRFAPDDPSYETELVWEYTDALGQAHQMIEPID
jgi:hypothetical protein